MYCGMLLSKNGNEITSKSNVSVSVFPCFHIFCTITQKGIDPGT